MFIKAKTALRKVAKSLKKGLHATRQTLSTHKARPDPTDLKHRWSDATLVASEDEKASSMETALAASPISPPLAEQPACPPTPPCPSPAALPAETLPVNTLPMETLPVEILLVETLPVNTLPIETLPVDTLLVETLSVNPLPVAAPRPTEDISLTTAINVCRESAERLERVGDRMQALSARLNARRGKVGQSVSIRQATTAASIARLDVSERLDVLNRQMMVTRERLGVRIEERGLLRAKLAAGPSHVPVTAPAAM
ncbi:hypothetical protein IWQ60_004461 [Tieghemiomyces parasiticus]|uniref:Uncharacterized protein n=1 Tax=Tieghemiomyces parasiticus TaxID=78921 RepID=A0A9W8A7S8_9FUNG|nr:hypothetical protein IWQ60_004461 [Tieghemiomyces parasiticus]